MEIERQIMCTLGSNYANVAVNTDHDIPCHIVVGKFVTDTLTGLDRLDEIRVNEKFDCKALFTYDLCKTLYSAKDKVSFWIDKYVLDRYSDLLGIERSMPRMWGCRNCTWKCLRYDFDVDVNLLSPPITESDVQEYCAYDAVTPVDYEGYNSRHARHHMDLDETKKQAQRHRCKSCLCIRNRVHLVNALKRNTQRFLSNYDSNLLNNIHRGRCLSLGGTTRSRYQNYVSLSDANTRIQMQPPLTHMTCCICIQYVSDLDRLLQRVLTKKLNIAQLVHIVKEYIYPYVQIPKHMGILNHVDNAKYIFARMS